MQLIYKSLIPTSSCSFYDAFCWRTSPFTLSIFSKEDKRHKNLLNVTFLQQRTRTLESKNTIVEKKTNKHTNQNYNTKDYQRNVKNWKPASVMTLVYCINSGLCCLEWDWFTTLHFAELARKIISAIITLSSCRAEVGAPL